MSKLRNIIILISLQIPLFVFGTLQSPDKLIMNGKEYELHTYILEAYFENNPEKRPKSKTLSITSLHRGYWATYEIIDGVCYLTDVTLPIPDSTKHEKLEIIYKSVLHEIFNTDKNAIPIDWFKGIIHMTNKFEYEGEPVNIDRHTILEINNSKTGEIRSFTGTQLEDFCKQQFRLFKKTEEYDEIKKDFRSKSINEAKIEEIVESNILYYSKSILVKEKE